MRLEARGEMLNFTKSSSLQLRQRPAKIAGRRSIKSAAQDIFEAKILKMELTHERHTMSDPKANDCDRNHAKGAYSLAVQHSGRNYCRIDAGRSAVSGPAADEWQLWW